MKISQVGIELIKSEEGTVLYPYDDATPKGMTRRLRYDPVSGRYQHEDGSPPHGHATIGTGHLIRPGEVFGDITMERNDEILRADVADVEAALARQVPDDAPGWNQHRYDAGCDFGINAGALAFTKYHVLPYILSGDMVTCEKQWKDVNKSVTNGIRQTNPVLVRRRAREWALFVTPMPEEPVDAATILARVSAWADRETEAFRTGDPLPDEGEPPRNES